MFLTEAGFGADLGGQKFMDFVSNHLDKRPDAVVVVATVRALKYQAEESTDHLDKENIPALEKGFANLEASYGKYGSLWCSSNGLD